jgi:poly(3-hydroxybutyrate) depolymerase
MVTVERHERLLTRMLPALGADAGDVTRLQYTDCADDPGVVLYTIKGEGHQWPGGKPIVARFLVGQYSHSIDATRQMWAFFREHQLPRKESGRGCIERPCG